MSHAKNQRIYALTNRDADRIRALLLAVEEAIAEIIDYRCVRPLDPAESFPLEAAVYRQTSQIMKDCDVDPDILF